jgi:hypothetical protein
MNAVSPYRPPVLPPVRATHAAHSIRFGNLEEDPQFDAKEQVLALMAQYLAMGESALQSGQWQHAKLLFERMTASADRSPAMKAEMAEIQQEFMTQWPYWEEPTARQQLRNLLRLEGQAFAHLGRLHEENHYDSPWQLSSWLKWLSPNKQQCYNVTMATNCYLTGLERILAGLPQLTLAFTPHLTTASPDPEQVEQVFAEMSEDEIQAAGITLNILERYIALWSDPQVIRTHHQALTSQAALANLPRFQQIALEFAPLAEALASVQMGADSPRVKRIQAKRAQLQAMLSA